GVNVGGSSYTDSKGQVWSADFGFNTGSLSGCAPGATVTGTADPTLFKSARYGPTPPSEMQYSFAVANGNYQVNLYFAETCPGQVVGGRVFDVQMQSATVFSALDIFAAAGGNTALVKSANVTVTNGTLTIQFVHRIDNPIVSAIEIVPLSGTDPAPISVSLAPTSAGVQVNQTQPFTATVQNDAQNKGVTWSLSGTGCSGNACGTLTNVTTTSVTYNAPASAPNPATVGLTATSVADNTRTSAATITVTAAAGIISVSISPRRGGLTLSQTMSFTAAVTNDNGSAGVTWSATAGSFSTQNTAVASYVAPHTAGVVTVTATSVTDVTKSASATIRVTDLA